METNEIANEWNKEFVGMAKKWSDKLKEENQDGKGLQMAYCTSESLEVVSR